VQLYISASIHAPSLHSALTQSNCEYVTLIFNFAHWFEFVFLMCAQHSIKMYVLILWILKIVDLNPNELNCFSCVCLITRCAHTFILTSLKLCSNVWLESTVWRKLSYWVSRLTFWLLHTFQYLCDIWKLVSKIRVTLLWMSSSDSKWDPFKEIFSFGNIRWSHRAKSGDYGGCSNTVFGGGDNFTESFVWEGARWFEIHLSSQRFCLFLWMCCCCTFFKTRLAIYFVARNL
jgi:hypothetical protein